jgi:hypothetical protein
MFPLCFLNIPHRASVLGWIKNESSSRSSLISSKTSERLEHSRHRSPINFLVNLIAGLIASCHQSKKPSLGLQLLALSGA